MIELSGIPKLHRPVMVTAFEGWNDAADAATDAVEMLETGLAGQADRRGRPRGLLRLSGQPPDRVAHRRRQPLGFVADHPAVARTRCRRRRG